MIQNKCFQNQTDDVMCDNAQVSVYFVGKGTHLSPRKQGKRG